MMKRAVLGGICATLLVAAVIGIVAITTRSSSGHAPAASNNLSASSKTITALCSAAAYQDACLKTLNDAKINDSSSSADIIRAAVNAITGEASGAYEKALELDKNATGSIDKDGFAFCRELFGDATEQLQAILAEAENGRRLDDFQAWLSMVISYHTNCLASIESPQLGSEMTAALKNTTELTDNAIVIVAGVEELMKDLDLNLTAPASGAGTVSGRQLLDGDEIPAWITGAERKLLAAGRRGGGGGGMMRPNAVVAKDGSGQFKTITAALNAMPETYRGRYVIYVKAGIYNEKVTVDKTKPNLFMYGDGPRKTMVTGRLNYADGVGTYRTATFSVLAPGFIAKSMGFSNTAGPQGHQAVALRINGDAAVLYNCRIDGFQDSFYSQTGRHFVRNCVISGTVDFIFGDSLLVIQNTLIILRRPMDHQENTVTANGKYSPNERGGITIQNCRIVPDLRLYPDRLRIASYLGRPWKQYSTTIVMESTIGDLIRPEGWLAWNGGFALDTLYYAEYNNRGPGAGTSRRVRWKGFRVIRRKEAMQWTAGSLLAGNSWIPFSGVPYALSLMK